jgi:hypothetical protein
MVLTALVVHCARCERGVREETCRRLPAIEGLLFMTLLTRQAFVCRSQLQLFPPAHPSLLASSAYYPQASAVLSCTICTTCNPTRQPAGHVKSRSLPRVAIDVILWNALHVPWALAARLLLLVGVRPSSSYRLALRLARLRQHRPDTLNYALPLNNSLTVSVFDSALLA